MTKLIYVLLILINLVLYTDSFSQYNNQIQTNSPPWIPAGIYSESVKSNPYSTAYAYKLIGSGSQLYRFNVGNPGSITNIGGTNSYLFSNADFANPEGVWKFYTIDQRTPFPIFEVDTATGGLTNIGNVSNLKDGHKPRLMSWDHTTNTMYVLSQNSLQTEMQLYSMYWPTKELTWIGPLFTVPGKIWCGAFNGNGNFFGIDNNTSSLWKMSKLTGEWSQVGPLGHPASYFQAAGFDKSSFGKMLWCGYSDTVGLFEVDTVTGAASLIGKFPWTTDPSISVGFVPFNGPQIIHTPLQNTINLSGPYIVNAYIFSTGSGISSAKILWSRNNSSITDSTSMVYSGGGNWTGNIPGNGTFSTYRYCIKTLDSANRFAVAPFRAPDSLYKFNTAANDTAKPVISHTPLTQLPILQWPNNISAVVMDNTGIDSVWVRYDINNNASKRFKLINGSGNIYSANFNSTYADIREGDVINYRIIAQDNSVNHNKDSSVLFSFTITVSEGYCCIGNENQIMSGSTPFATYMKGCKSQMLYTSSEIALNGGVEGDILKIGFFVTRIGPLPMNRFNVKMQNTNIDILNSGFINTNWYLVYSGSYTVQALGWQYINLQTPFHWDGVSNIIIEICFGNTEESNYGSSIQGSSVGSMYYYGFTEDTLACTQNPGTPIGNSAKPNICFNLIPSIGIVSNNSKIPVEYKLYQNFPNPFNPVTKISYGIPANGFASLKVFDILGREVATLVNEIKSKGIYTVDYDASYLSSGIYLYRLECNGFVNTKRMILLK